MTNISEIAQLGAKVLRLQAQAVTDSRSAEIQRIIETMQDTLSTTQGVGIAAPQISISKRIIIIASRPTPRYPSAPLMEPTVMINPAFQTLSDTREKDWEGCLSIPGIRALVPRYIEILINYTNQQGILVEARLEGFVARIFQHEFDHLEGKVYLDRVEDNRDIFAESEYLKM
ncbi:MAG: peptide deformylase [Methylococcaceae bacterium]|jgi:peptide deformylase|nr:peptide deformylase [Methylococcaceae bacterium]MDD1637458.1 peptide deformylase [Methylococcaceae bacterium]MDD1644190.1 peptide deformylase [Methylococcaceae bacterium]OYV17552.1 MAG: peptide deformylase [Methylococcaceae bacterium NSM2-1]